MIFNFKEQNILVTGGPRGIGKAIVMSFLESGASVWATYKQNEEAANLLLQEAIQNGYEGKLHIVRCDMQKEEELAHLFTHFEEKGIQLQVVINNAGIKRDGLLANLSSEDWHSVINTNLTGSFLISKLSILHFMHGRYGRLIHISSLSGKMGLPGQANYAASKAAQMAIVKSLSKEVGKKNITVNAIAPGFIATDMVMNEMAEEQIAAYKKEIPLKRLGTPQEVAYGVLFLASREASYITGTTLEIGGGLG